MRIDRNNRFPLQLLKSTNPLILALDFNDLDESFRWASLLKHFVGHIKIGLELFVTHGYKSLEVLSKLDIPIFLDLKLHDIPNTVARTVESLVARHQGLSMLTVHISGGKEMLKAAQIAARGKVKIIGVTVLTSLSESDAKHNVQDHVANLASIALSCNLYGVVCSSHEISAVNKENGDKLKTIVPGIRYPENKINDQVRTNTPEAALKEGADYLVLGRVLTTSTHPIKIIQKILEYHQENQKM